MSGILERLGWYITVCAAIVVLIACIIIQAPLFWMAVALSATIVTFWVIGDIIRYYFVRNVFPPVEEPTEEEQEYAPEYIEETAGDADPDADAYAADPYADPFAAGDPDANVDFADDMLADLSEQEPRETENAFME